MAKANTISWKGESRWSWRHIRKGQSGTLCGLEADGVLRDYSSAGKPCPLCKQLAEQAIRGVR